MATGIQWTDETWNPVVGCTRVSPGCAHCYAKALHDMRHRAHQAGRAMAPQYAQPFEVVQLKPDRLLAPLSWRKPRRVFVNSVSDLFHDDVPVEFIADVFAVMAQTPRHTYQVLTKRPARMLAVLQAIGEAHQARAGSLWPLPNVWLGVSVENQRFANERIPLLLEAPAAVRFLSCEPLLGPIDFYEAGSRGGEDGDPCAFSALRGEDGVEPPIPGIDWVIVGGESGTGARRFDLDWATSILRQCRDAGVAAFVKQIGAYATLGGPLFPYSLGGHGGNMERWPNELRVREFPAVGS